MSDALKRLTQGADHWAFYIRRSPLDWDTGAEQSEGLSILKGDSIELDEPLDERLVRSRQVQLVVSWHDGGSALVDVTGRSYRILTPSQSARETLASFSKKFKSEKGKRMYRPALIGALFTFPFTVGFPIFFLASLVDPEARRTVWLDDDPNNKMVAPAWADTCLTVALILYPFALAYASWLLYRRVRSGGLRVWRPAFTRMSLLTLLYRVKSEGIRLEFWRQILPGVVIGVLIALLTFWFV